MSRAVFLLLFLPFSLFAQTVQTQFFRAILLPTSEVPPVSSTAHGVADVLASVVLDSSGQVVSGTVDVLARITFTATVTATGLGIWSGNVGQNGTLALNSVLSASSSYVVQINGDTIHQAIQVAGDNPTLLNALRGMVQNPAGYYVNLLTTVNPNGVIRGQLLRAQSTVLMALMSSDNAFPAPFNAGYGVAQVVAIGTRDASGNWNSAEVYLWATYNTQDQTAFSGLQIHPGAAGVVSTASLVPTLPGGLTPMPTGTGSIGPFYMELTTTAAAQTGTFTNLFNNPGSQYIDLRTVGNPLGLMRGQLQATGSAALQVPLSSTNELHTTSAPGAAPAALTIYTLLNPDGSIAAGSLLADMDYRFNGATQFLGLYLQQAPAGQDGPPTLQVTPDFHSDTGFGNYFTWSAPILDPGTLTSILQNPDGWYLDLHTVNDPTGAARAQLQPAATEPSGITAVINADLDKTAAAVAPGGLITIFGTNLSKVPCDLRGWSGSQLPYFLNGLAVNIGGRQAAMLYVSPQQINVQAPVDVPAGAQLMILSNANGPFATYTVNVAPSAPGIFFYPAPAILKNADFSLVTAGNPAKPGDVILVYCTGLGQTTPALSTGVAPVAGVLAQTTPVAATIGGQAAGVIYSIASPGFAGLYQVAITVPAGLTGSVPLALQQGGATSNSVNLALR
ncbi:CHRD domain containing protein [Candidatus Sulfopaludibacter sp. SbA3]|nr:CHRD domain containing protein [Candidatus Sulfopaludibacter sp. SbA3]